MANNFSLTVSVFLSLVSVEYSFYFNCIPNCPDFKLYLIIVFKFDFANLVNMMCNYKSHQSNVPC